MAQKLRKLSKLMILLQYSKYLGEIDTTVMLSIKLIILPYGLVFLQKHGGEVKKGGEKQTPQVLLQNHPTVKMLFFMSGQACLYASSLAWCCWIKKSVQLWIFLFWTPWLDKKCPSQQYDFKCTAKTKTCHSSQTFYVIYICFLKRELWEVNSSVAVLV